MKKNITLRGLLCLLLAMALLMGMVACGSDPAPTTQPSQNMQASQPTTQATQPTTQATQPTTAFNPPTTVLPTTAAPTEPPKPTPEPLVYTLIQEDVDLYYSLLENCETLSIEGLDMEAIEAASEALDAQYEYLNEQYSIANILYYCDSYSTELKQQYLDTVDICTAANDAYIQMARRVYLSDSPAKDMLFEGWTEEDIAMLLAYDEQIAQLRARNEEITVEYNSARKDDLKMQLYIEFVQNNNEIAQFYGYSNYYEYAYDMAYDRDYGMEDLVLIRQYAKEYLAPVFDTALRNFYNSFYGLPQADQTTVSDFLYKDYNKVRKDYVGLYLEALPEEMADTFEYMITMDSTFTSSKRAKAGAFTTMVGDRSYCYFGPGYGNSLTVVHEAGHYYASRHTALNSIPLDLAEVHSQGNEWLFVAFLDGQMTSTHYKALIDYRLYSDLAMIMICLMVDEFEQMVYTRDLTGYTPADFNALMESVATQYFDMKYINDNLTDIQNYWRMVVVDQPAYYISYAVSSIAAIDLYTLARKDFNGAVAVYQKLCEEVDVENGFLGNLNNAGLAGPFDEEFYQEIVQIISDRA